MKRLFFVLLLVGAGVVALGFYQGWLHFGSESADGKTHITLTVDKDKIQSDKEKVLDKVHGIGHQGTGKDAVPPATSAGQGAPVVDPPGNQK